MARPQEIVDADLVQRAKAALDKNSEHKIGVRLQAIVSCGEHSKSVVASVMGVHQATVWRWCKRFREDDVGGLRDRPKGHNPSKLTKEHKDIIYQWLQTSKNSTGDRIHWTIPRLQKEILDIFGIEISKTPLWLVVRKMGFRLKVPRPHHAKADHEAQQVFKKNG